METRNFGVFLLLAFVFFWSVHVNHGIKWLSLYHSHLQWNVSTPKENHGRGIRSGVRSPCSLARRRYGLERLQAKMCRTSTETMPHVQQAAALAVETCQNVFEFRRWNCTSAARAPFLTPDLLRATREQAYVYAISSAALTYAMARACSSGSLHHCTCASHPGDPPGGTFKWGGCGDNLKWGKSFAKRFLDNVEKNHEKTSKLRRRNAHGDDSATTEEVEQLKTQIAEVNLYNNRIGRKVLAESITTQCKCHGVSGSCSIKTCWRALPQMALIGQQLLVRYTNARELSKSKESTSSKGKSKNGDALVYLSRSPDYCTKDETLGSFGTVGRKCNVTSNNTDSCRQLCCGRGYRTVVEEKIERCQCRYYYCCYVKCKICRTLTQRHECS